jgi:hypothetical protein
MQLLTDAESLSSIFVRTCGPHLFRIPDEGFLCSIALLQKTLNTIAIWIKVIPCSVKRYGRF